MSESESTTGRDIGVDVPIPESPCNDAHCPFHGKLSVRGQIIEGTVMSNKMGSTVVVEREILRIVPKYSRYVKRKRRFLAHRPACVSVDTGDSVRIMECRPLSKTVSFVVIENRVRT